METITIPQTGIEDIDAEHASLLECLNRLEFYTAKGQGYAATIDAVFALEQYVINHFSHEEDYLARRNFPNLQEHINQHRAISTHIAMLKDLVLDGGEFGATLNAYIRQWILTHIGEEDMEFARYFGTAVSA